MSAMISLAGGRPKCPTRHDSVTAIRPNGRNLFAGMNLFLVFPTRSIEGLREMIMPQIAHAECPMLDA